VSSSAKQSVGAVAAVKPFAAAAASAEAKRALAAAQSRATRSHTSGGADSGMKTVDEPADVLTPQKRGASFTGVTLTATWTGSLRCSSANPEPTEKAM
jgi:hypothetical protein